MDVDGYSSGRFFGEDTTVRIMNCTQEIVIMEDDLEEISMNIKIRVSLFSVSLVTNISNIFLCLNHALMQTLGSKRLDFYLHAIELK